jgi:tetratricopeptide (TPR) repeat protein
MLAIKKPSAELGKLLAAAGALLVVAGCAPSGPRALLKGERLLQQEKYPQAIETLKVATQLLPKNAAAWNHLGLAYHLVGQPGNAVPAYRKALALDRDLMAARYNLGCLWLEQNNPAAAMEELASYVSHPRHAKDAAGWAKLGAAQLRARRLDEADRSLTQALRLDGRTPEVLNNLGVIQAQRRRAVEAVAHFNAALALQRAFAPALLNLGVVYQQQPATRPAALQKYREYLALQPPSAQREAVEALVQQLEAELHPTPVLRPAPTNLVAAPSARTNLPAAVATNLAAHPAATVPPAAIATAPRTNVSAAPAPSPRPVASATSPTTTPVAPPKPEVTRPASSSVGATTVVEVTRVPESLVIKPAQDVAAAATSGPSSSVPTSATASAPTTLPGNVEAAAPKKNFFQRLNPFARRPRPGTNAPAESAPVVYTQTGRTVVAARTVDTPPPAHSPATAAPDPPPPPPVPRYAYLAPAKPATGNREAARPFFERAAQAHQARRTTEALGDYQKAIALDAAYFDAYYNLGLVAYAARDWKQSLQANEFALALRPDSVDARYNLALALKQAGYFLDAAEELQKILRDHPNETRARVSLGNLYAQQLNQPRAAREHYQKVLAANPSHPQAAQIRYWLAAHP